MTQTCYRCEGSGKAPFDATLADKVGITRKHHECPVCLGTGLSGPKPVWNTKIDAGEFEPVPDDFWDTWGV